MASEKTIQKLYETALGSSSFKGMSKEDIWKACLTYQDRNDKSVEMTIGNIMKKGEEESAESENKQEMMEKGHEIVQVLREKEEAERLQDSQNAEKILEDFFNLWYNNVI